MQNSVAYFDVKEERTQADFQPKISIFLRKLIPFFSQSDENWVWNKDSKIKKFKKKKLSQQIFINKFFEFSQKVRVLTNDNQQEALPEQKLNF